MICPHCRICPGYVDVYEAGELVERIYMSRAGEIGRHEFVTNANPDAMFCGACGSDVLEGVASSAAGETDVH